MQRYKNNTKIFIVLVLFNYSYSGNRRNTVPFPFSEELSLCNTQFVFCGLEMGGSDLDGDFSCFILRLNDDDGLATERLRREGEERLHVGGMRRATSSDMPGARCLNLERQFGGRTEISIFIRLLFHINFINNPNSKVQIYKNC